MGNLCSKFGKNRSTNYVTFLSTDAGRTDGRTDGRLRDFVFCPMHMHSIGQTIICLSACRNCRTWVDSRWFITIDDQVWSHIQRTLDANKRCQNWHMSIMFSHLTRERPRLSSDKTKYLAKYLASKIECWSCVLNSAYFACAVLNLQKKKKWR